MPKREQTKTEEIATSLMIADRVIHERAKLDGNHHYDTKRDEDGHITSLLLSLRHHCNTFGLSWSKELSHAMELYEDDLIAAMEQGYD